MEIWVVTFQTQVYKSLRNTFTKKVILIEEKSDIWKSINFSMKKYVKNAISIFQWMHSLFGKFFYIIWKFTTHITKSSSSGSGVIESCLDMLFRRRLALSPEATFEKPTAAPIACPASSRCSIEKESSLMMLETLIFRSIWAFAWIRPLDLFLVIWKQKQKLL